MRRACSNGVLRTSCKSQRGAASGRRSRGWGREAGDDGVRASDVGDLRVSERDGGADGRCARRRRHLYI